MHPDVVCSSRQSMTLNPLIEENTISTTKKQIPVLRSYAMNNYDQIEYYHNDQQYNDQEDDRQHQEQDQDVSQIHGNGETDDMHELEYRLILACNQEMHKVFNEVHRSLGLILQNSVDPNYVHNEAFHSIGVMEELYERFNDAQDEFGFDFFQSQFMDPTLFNQNHEKNNQMRENITSFIDDKDKRSTFTSQRPYDDGYDVYSQNGVSKDDLLSPIPHAMNSVEYQNFGTFSQQNDTHADNEHPVKRELDMMQSEINGKPHIDEHLKSKTEYSYQDFDNFPQNNQRNHKNKRKSKSKQRHRKNSRSSSEQR